MPNIDKLASTLSKPGPHRVLKGDLAFAGIPGVLFTPEDGLGLPAVAFGHGWMVAPGNYSATLRHLASWGIVAAAPGTQRGLVPSHTALANDLSVTLDICTGVRLGTGKISVRPDRLALVGHGMGAGAAILAASRRSGIAAVAALYPARVSPDASTVAPSVSAPALVLGSPTELVSVAADPLSLAEAFGGSTILRTVNRSSSDGLVEGRRLLAAFGVGGAEKKTQKITRALLTGFLLHRLTEDDTYEGFSDPHAVIKNTELVDPAEPAPELPKPRGNAIRQVIHLLGR